MRHALQQLLMAWLFLAAPAWALVPVPPLEGHVTDQTGILAPAEIAQLQTRLAAYEAGHQRKIAVLLVDTTAGEELEAFADRVMKAWKLDDPLKGGALLLWSAEGFVLIRAAGPLLERLDDTAQSDILSRWVVPAFGRGEAGVGVQQGVERMIAVLAGEAAGAPKTASDATIDLDIEALSAESDEGLAVGVSFGIPAWFGTGQAEATRLLRGVSRNAWTGLDTWFEEAGEQAAQLRVLVPGLFLQMRGERVEPPFHPISLGAAYVFAGAVVLAALLLLARHFTASLAVIGLIGGIALWAATGFVALAGLFLLTGLLSPLLVRALRALLRGSDDTEREPASATAAALSQARSSVRPLSAARLATSVRPATATRPASAANATVHPSSQMPMTDLARRQKIDESLDLAGRIAQEQLRKLRPKHAIIALVILVLSPLLAVFAALAMVGLVGYREGLAHALVARFVADPALRDRLLQRLPEPPSNGRN